jgi:hypothetical protein
MEQAIEKLYGELATRGIRFRPHCWLSQEWFSPDGIPGNRHTVLSRASAPHEHRAAPHARSGRRQPQLADAHLRHEAGHAIDSAYRLRRRQRWREVFGPASLPYPDTYRPRPGSRRFVQHLGAWYAQAHPTEDFAETFAVWLKPNSAWRREYLGWPAFAKLEFIDELAAEIGDAKPLVTERTTHRGRRRETRTLRQHYERQAGALPHAAPFRRRRIAAQGIHDGAALAPRAKAASVLREMRNPLRQQIVRRVPSANTSCIRCCA